MTFCGALLRKTSSASWRSEAGDVLFELLEFLLVAGGIFLHLGEVEHEIELDGGAHDVGLGGGSPT